MKRLSDLRKSAVNRAKKAYLLVKSKPLYTVCEYNYKKTGGFQMQIDSVDR